MNNIIFWKKNIQPHCGISIKHRTLMKFWM